MLVECALERPLLDHVRQAVERGVLQHSLHSLVPHNPRQDQKPGVSQSPSGFFLPDPRPPLPSSEPDSFPPCFPPASASGGEKIYLLTAAPEDRDPLFILLAVTEGDKATFEVFKVDADPCGEELNLCGEKWAKCHTKAVLS